jgi:ABC-type transport system substrate-binding protein/DNA-binding SARP family transcriptional activator/DNA-binding beta-propeller fold protein YncE
VEFRVLGPLEVIADGAAVPLGGPKQRALLAMLALHANEPVSRDRLVDGIWGDRLPANPGQALDTYVSRLRKVLGAARIERRSGGYALRVEPGELDLDRFEELATVRRYDEALSLWRGPALADLVFEPFARAATERLEERRLVVLEEQFDIALAGGGGAELVPQLEQLVHEHPLRDRLLGQLMLALYRAGRHAAALDAYRTAKRRLAEELGLVPAPELQELERRILAHDPSLGRPRRPRARGRRHRGAAAAAVALLVVVAAAAAVVFERRGTHAASSVQPTSSRLVSVDTQTSRLTGATALPNTPTALVYGFGSLWAADPTGEQVLRIDRRTGTVVDRISLQAQPSALAVGGGALWVASAVGGLVTRIDPQTAKPTQTQQLGGANPSALLFTHGELWVADQTDHSVVRIDPQTGSARQSITLDVAPSSLAYADGELFAAGYEAGAVDQIDVASSQVVARLPVGEGPSALAAAGGSLWVANSLAGTLWRIDAVTGQTRSVVSVGSGPSALAVTPGAIWVANEYSGTVVEIDVGNGRVRRVVDAGGRPSTLASSGGRLWAGSGPSGNLHRGGTLRLSGTVRPNSLDPAFELVGSWEGAQLPRLVYDSLVTFDNSPGPDGLRLVPDLAVELPNAGASGTAYVFHLRPGIRYSTGRLVQAGDFRRAFERIFRARSPARSNYQSIVGAAACIARPATCDLSKGVVTNDHARTVVFHLTAPDPTFLYKLTLFAFSAPVPPGVPVHDRGYSPVAGTGPYRFVRTSLTGLRLERNPYFHEWSHAAQPDGNPDVIEWRFPRTHDQEIADIEAGRADWTFDFIPIPQLRKITRLHPAQLHVNPAFIVEFIPLNTTKAPFDSAKVRRAFNLAIDRREIARLYGGSVIGAPLCQTLPPGLPGHVPYCPYTRNPTSAGTYDGPDLARARRLVRESGRSGARIVVRGSTDATAIPPAEPAYVARVLRSLGFKVTLRLENAAVMNREDRHTFQLSVDGDWLLDFPSAAALLPQFFGCHGTHTHEYFCNPALDRLMRRAADTDDPVRAGRLWSAADRLITDEAYWVPTIALNEVDFVSSRLRNYVYNPVWGFLADQAWVD